MKSVLHIFNPGVKAGFYQPLFREVLGSRGGFHVPIPCWSYVQAFPLSFTACFHLLTRSLPRVSRQQTKAEAGPPVTLPCSRPRPSPPTLRLVSLFSLAHPVGDTVLPPALKCTPSSPPSLRCFGSAQPPAFEGLHLTPHYSVVLWILTLLLIQSSPVFPLEHKRQDFFHCGESLEVASNTFLPVFLQAGILVSPVTPVKMQMPKMASVLWHLCFEDTPGGF